MHAYPTGHGETNKCEREREMAPHSRNLETFVPVVTAPSLDRDYHQNVYLFVCLEQK